MKGDVISDAMVPKRFSVSLPKSFLLDFSSKVWFSEQMYFIDFHQVGFLSATYLRAVGHDCPIHDHISYASSQMLMMMIMVMVMLLLIMVIIISTIHAPSFLCFFIFCGGQT